MEKKFQDSKYDYAIICKKCGHVSEMHNHDDYDGWSCNKKDCNCDNFNAKTDENGNVIYLKGEIPCPTPTK